MTDNKKEPLITITNQVDIEITLKNINANIQKTMEYIRNSNQSLLTIFKQLKFEEIGNRPFADSKDNEKLNFVEQLNQSYTYMTGLKAIEILLKEHPDAGGFKMFRATDSGLDIESVKENLVAVEMFAAVNTTNNDKLKKDVKKILKEDVKNFEYRYIFHMTPENQKTKLIEEKDGIKIYSIGYDEV